MNLSCYSMKNRRGELDHFPVVFLALYSLKGGLPVTAHQALVDDVRHVLDQPREHWVRDGDPFAYAGL